MNLMRAFNYTYSKYPFTLLAYCIMTNHYHLLIRSEVDLSKVMAYINRRYSDYYSKRYQHVGRIYEKRYYSALVDGPNAILSVSNYIHRNPIETKIPLVENLEDYPYSSFPFYADEKKTPPRFLDTGFVAAYLPKEYEKSNQAYCHYCKVYRHDIEEDRRIVSK